jgi:hypothetical protein
MSIVSPIRRYHVRSMVNFAAEVCRMDKMFPFVLLFRISMFSKSSKYKYLFNNPLVALILLLEPMAIGT